MHRCTYICQLDSKKMHPNDFLFVSFHVMVKCENKRMPIYWLTWRHWLGMESVEIFYFYFETHSRNNIVTGNAFERNAWNFWAAVVAPLIRPHTMKWARQKVILSQSFFAIVFVRPVCRWKHANSRPNVHVMCAINDKMMNIIQLNNRFFTFLPILFVLRKILKQCFAHERWSWKKIILHVTLQTLYLRLSYCTSSPHAVACNIKHPTRFYSVHHLKMFLQSSSSEVLVW